MQNMNNSYLKESDLESIKRVAILFLYQDIERTAFSPIAVIHPIFESGISAVKRGNELVAVNILENKDDLKAAQKKVEDKILNAETVDQVYMIIRKSYRMTFLKFAGDHLSNKDMSNLLAHAWTSSEDPNNDVNVSLSMATRWFRGADKSILMDEDEYRIYQELPDTLTVYRGVGIGRNPKGLSWTRNIKTAEWFANRFNRDGKKGYVQSATVRKEQVLAYFNRRGEDEVVVDTSKLKIKKRKESIRETER